MTPYLIVSATNRAKSNSYILSNIYQRKLSAQGIEADILDLEKLPKDFVFTALYDQALKNPEFNIWLEKINQSQKILFVVPEYNGSFPGVLKAFIDGLDFPYSFKNKKAAMVGLSSGTQGSALALSHLTDILNYLGVHVLAEKPRLMHIESHLNTEKVSLSKEYDLLIEEQIESFVGF